jgi:hypothetical protein
MKRLYYLVPSIDGVQEISDDLHQQGVTDWRFHIVSKDEAGLYTHQLHSASILDRTDLVRFLERGVMVGALAGICVIVALALFMGLELPLGAWLAMFLFSLIAGAWIGGIGGISSENYRLRRFHDAIEAGSYLVMVDVPKTHVERTKESMKRNHPDAELQNVGSSVNHPFADDGQMPAT